MSLNFNQFYQMVIENITTDAAGVGGTSTSTTQGDTYAPGDSRMPHILGSVKKNDKTKRRSKKKKLDIQRRTMNTSL